MCSHNSNGRVSQLALTATGPSPSEDAVPSGGFPLSLWDAALLRSASSMTTRAQRLERARLVASMVTADDEGYEPICMSLMRMGWKKANKLT